MTETKTVLANWLSDFPERGVVHGERFHPGGLPPDLSPNRGAIWKVTPLRRFSRPIRLGHAKVRAFLHRKLEKQFAPTKVIFVHVPKNAGTSVSEVLYGRSAGHSSAQVIAAALPRRLQNECVKLSIVREPRARIVSAFRYLKGDPTTPADRRFRDECLSDIRTFEELVEAIRKEDVRRKLFVWPHFRDQCQFISDRQGRLLLDCVISMDRMDLVASCLSALMGKVITLPRSNSSEKQQMPDVDWRQIDEVYAEDHKLYSKASSGIIEVASRSRVLPIER